MAVLRAYIRTMNTCFASDYKKDASFVTYLAGLLKIDETVLKSTPPLHVDWQIRAGTTTCLQSAYEAQGVPGDAKPLPESKTVDRTPYEEGVGHTP